MTNNEHEAREIYGTSDMAQLERMEARAEANRANTHRHQGQQSQHPGSGAGQDRQGCHRVIQQLGSTGCTQRRGLLTMSTDRVPLLTVADIEMAVQDERWLGFGYLGERRNRLTSTDPEAPATDPKAVAEIDRRIIAHANTEGWTYEQLFDWCNSKHGRWLADVVFSGGEWSKVVGWRLLDLPHD